MLSKSCMKSVNHFLYWATKIHMEIYLDAYGKTTSWQCTMEYTISTTGTPKAIEYTCADFSKQNRVRDVKQIRWHGTWQSSEVSYFLCQLSIYLYMCNIRLHSFNRKLSFEREYNIMVKMILKMYEFKFYKRCLKVNWFKLRKL